MCSVTIDPVKKAEIDRLRALSELDAWFAAQCEAGVVTSGGWRLKMRDADVALYTGNFVLAKEAAALGAPVPPLVDADGGVHAIAGIEELTAIMLGYGQARVELLREYARRKAEIGA